MNFTCDKCQRRYSIADEKVRGKTVKVRCKHCQNVISVEGPPAEVEESTRVVSLADVERLRAQAAEEEAAAKAPAASAPAAQTPWEDDEPTRAAPPRDARAPWYVMVKNQQQGPLDEPALRELVDSGAVNARSYFWQQGLADWRRGSDIPELADLFAAPPAPEPPAPPPAPEPVRRAPEPPRRAAPVPEPEPAWQQQQPAASEPAWDDQPAASGQDAAWAASGSQEQETPWQPEPEPAPAQRQARGQANANGNGPQLGELFSDLDLPGRSEEGEQPPEDGEGAQAEAGSEPEPEPEPEKPVKGKKKKGAAQPGEHTRVAMAQSGVTRRNPWWKIALVVVLFLAVPLAGAFVLDQTNVMPLTVTRVNAQGQQVKQSVFSSEGASALRDQLMGKQPPPPPPAPVQPPVEEKPAAAEKRPESGVAPKAEPTEPKTAEGEPPSEELKAVYANGEKQDVGPEVRKDAEVAAPDSSDKAGPPPEELAKVMGQVQPAIQSCVDAELKKNPKFKGGKVMLVATVGSSGTVKKVSFDRTDVEGSKVGDCIKTRAKRMVFSSFEGDDVELQIPLVLGTSM